MEFDEFHAGQVIETGVRQVTEAEILEFARRYDPQSFHVDPQAASSSRWGGIIASGWHTCSIAMSLVAEHVLAGSASLGSPGVDELRWPAPVRPGDALRVRVTVQTCRVSSTRGYGIVTWRWEVLNQHDVCVLSLVATSLFDVAGARVLATP